jgi:hypothetical protein
MSRRARLRQAARPWQQPQPDPPAIPWDVIAADLQRREQQQQPKAP